MSFICWDRSHKVACTSTHLSNATIPNYNTNSKHIVNNRILQIYSDKSFRMYIYAYTMRVPSTTKSMHPNA